MTTGRWFRELGRERGLVREPYLWRQTRGEFFEWDGKDPAKPMFPEEVKAELAKTPSGKFEIRSGRLEANAAWVAGETGRGKNKKMFPV